MSNHVLNKPISKRLSLKNYITFLLFVSISFTFLKPTIILLWTTKNPFIDSISKKITITKK